MDGRARNVIGAPPMRSVVRYFEESSLGQVPGAMERYKAAKILLGSLALMVGAVVLAMTLSTNSDDRVATKQPAVMWDVEFENP